MTTIFIYNEAQYRFLFDLWKQGYHLAELADWVGVSTETLRRNFARYNLRYERGVNMPPLSTFKGTFNDLGTVK